MFFLGSLFLAGCNVNSQLEEARVFEKCTYELASADSVYISGLNLLQIIKTKEFDLSSTPRVAMGFLNRNIPLSGKINLRIKNPTAKTAAINSFDYMVLFEGKEFLKGIINHPVRVDANGGSTVVPIDLNANIFNLVSENQSRSKLMNLIGAPGSGADTEESLISFKIRPSIGKGANASKLPGYITIDKKVTRKLLTAFISK